MLFDSAKTWLFWKKQITNILYNISFWPITLFRARDVAWLFECENSLTTSQHCTGKLNKQQRVGKFTTVHRKSSFTKKYASITMFWICTLNSFLYMSYLWSYTNYLWYVTCLNTCKVSCFHLKVRQPMRFILCWGSFSLKKVLQQYFTQIMGANSLER